MSRVLGIAYRALTTHLIRKAGYKPSTANTGAITLIQCFGSALDALFQFRMLFLDGVCVERPDGPARFRWVKVPCVKHRPNGHLQYLQDSHPEQVTPGNC